MPKENVIVKCWNIKSNTIVCCKQGIWRSTTRLLCVVDAILGKY